MKYIGIAIVFGAVLVFCRLYRRHLMNEIKNLEGFVSLISEMRRRAVSYLQSPSEWISDFKCDFDDGGFLSLVPEVGVRRAYEAVAERISVPSLAEPYLREFFLEFGRGYVDEEERRGEYTEGKLREIVSSEKKRAADKSKIVAAVALAVSGGAALFAL